MGQFATSIQQIYVAYFNRPADFAGLQFFESVVEANGGNTAIVAAGFAQSAEYTSTFAGLSNIAIVNRVYQNLFNRDAEPAGLAFWTNALDKGFLTVANVVTGIAAGAQDGPVNKDASAFANKVAAAVAFTDGLDSSAKILGYDGAAANLVAKAFIGGVTSDAATLAAATAGLPTTYNNVIAAQAATANTPQVLSLTAGIDNLVPTVAVGLKGNDTFVANATTGSGQTFTAFDNIDGGTGIDTLNVTSATGGAFTAPATATVKGIEFANIVGDSTITINTTGYTDLSRLVTSSVGASTVTAATTTTVTASAAQGAGNVAVTGGSTVSVATTGATGGTINVTGAAGAVIVTEAGTGASTLGAITVNGGTTVSVTQTQTNAAATTATNGSVNVTGSAATTAVTVNSAAAATASATVAGVNTSTVTITDVNMGSTTKAGTITTATVSNFSTLSIADNALSSLNLTGGSGNIIIDNSGLTTPTNFALALGLNGQTSGTLDDADIYTTLNVTTSGANSTLSNITFGGLTVLNVAGSNALTLTSAAGATKLVNANVNGAAGLSANFSGNTALTAVNSSNTTGATTVTINGGVTAFTGGAGVDSVTIATGFTKAVNLGAGNDTLVAATFTPTIAVSGGAGTDTFSIDAATAQTASALPAFAGRVTLFETARLTAATNQTVDLAVLGGFNAVSTAGGNGLTLNNLPTGSTLTLTGAGTAYTVATAAFTTGTADVLNLVLTDGSGAGVAFASTGVTAAGVETINVTTVDTQATPTGTFNDSVTLLGNDVKAIIGNGNAGLTLTAASTALTNVDASAIAAPGMTPAGLTFTAGALAAAATIKGSATGANIVTATASTKAVTYTGGSGADTVNISNAQANIINVGNGTNSVTLTTGANTVTGGTGADTVTATTGNNTVNLGNGANSFTATTGNNTYIGGTGVDTVTVGGGQNVITTGTGADIVTFTAAPASSLLFSTITDAHATMNIGLLNVGTETFNTTKVTNLPAFATFQDFANQVVRNGGNASVNAAAGFFNFSGDTYIVQSVSDGSSATATFTNGVDLIIKLTGIVDLSTATITGNILTLA